MLWFNYETLCLFYFVFYNLVHVLSPTLLHNQIIVNMLTVNSLRTACHGLRLQYSSIYFNRQF